MVEAVGAEPAGEERDAAAANLAQFMKLKSFEFNREHPSSEVVSRDLQQFSHGLLGVDPKALDRVKIDYPSSGTASANAKNKNRQKKKHNKRK